MATPTERWTRSTGNAVLGLVRDQRYTDRRMAPVLRYRDDRGTVHVVMLNHLEVAALRAGAATLFAADAKQVATWWEQLDPDGPDERPQACIPPAPKEHPAALVAARRRAAS